MVLAAYGTDGSISVLTSSQLDTATKVINILTPIEEITKDISADTSTISQNIPLVRGLKKVLEEQDNDHGVCTMKCKMLESLNIRFGNIEDAEFLLLATLRYKDKFFTSITSCQCAKEMLLSEYTYFVQESELEEPPTKRIDRDDGGSTKKSKLWGCLSGDHFRVRIFKLIRINA